MKNVPQNLKGRLVRKPFDDGNYYLGYIKSVGRAKGRLQSEGDEEDKTIYAHVVYEDKDQEDVDFDELSKIILIPISLLTLFPMTLEELQSNPQVFF